MFFSGKSKKETGPSGVPVGRVGEDAAEAYLVKLGYSIVERNYRRRFGEIDIVAKDGEDLVFVEVKTRKSQRYGSPFEAVNLRKQQKMSRVALDYLSRRKLEDHAARFDVVAVLLEEDSPPEIKVIKNAFEFCD